MAESPFDEPRELDAIQPELPVESALQLRLHHFFALTAVMAVLLASRGPIRDFGSRLALVPQLMHKFMLFWVIVHSILTSVAVTIVAYGLAWRRQGIRFFDQPGHWLLVEIATTTVFALLQQLANRAMFESRSSGDFEVTQTKMLAITVISSIFVVFRVALNIYIGVKKCHQRRWSRVFYFKALATLWRFVGSPLVRAILSPGWSTILLNFGDLLVLVMLSLATLIDRREGVRRDVLHRWGVIIQFALATWIAFLMVLLMYSLVLGLGWWGWA
jgi:hypothetical protein